MTEELALINCKPPEVVPDQFSLKPLEIAILRGSAVTDIHHVVLYEDLLHFLGYVVRPEDEPLKYFALHRQEYVLVPFGDYNSGDVFLGQELEGLDNNQPRTLVYRYVAPGSPSKFMELD